MRSLRRPLPPRRCLLTQLAARLAAAALALGGSGCVWRARVWRPPPLVTVEPVVGAFEPMWFDGAVVYYTEDGRPFYYLGADAYYIPPEHPRYREYVVYYHSHGGGYREWRRRHPPRHPAPPVVYHPKHRPSHPHPGHPPHPGPPPPPHPRPPPRPHR